MSMWLLPVRAGPGLAGRLVGEVVGWATAHGQRVCVMVPDDDVGAVQAYTRAGSTDHGVPQDWSADAPPECGMRNHADTSKGTRPA